MQRKYRFLVVDDDEPSRIMLEAILQEYGDVELAKNGLQGLLKFRNSIKQKTPFALVTLDMKMPELDGFAALECIRGLEHVLHAMPRAKILVMSSVDDRQTIVSALKTGADGYLLKPIQREKIEEKLSELFFLPTPAGRQRS